MENKYKLEIRKTCVPTHDFDTLIDSLDYWELFNDNSSFLFRSKYFTL